MSVNPIDNDDLYIAVSLAGLRSPGVVKLSGHDRVHDWDVKASNGATGASTTLKGDKPIEFKASFFLADAAERDAWPEFVALVRSTISGATPKALDIYHPDLAEQGITSVVLKSVAGAAHDGKGGQTIVVTFLEYKPPAKKGGSPNGSTSKAKANDPNAAANAELDALMRQFQDTPWTTTDTRGKTARDTERGER